VKGVGNFGVHLGSWFTAEQGESLWQSPDTERLKGKRDRALLAVLFSLVHLQPREQHRAIVDLIGKAGPMRTVPMPDWVKRVLDDWLNAAGLTSGRVVGHVNKAGRV
jgi:site-specific recombinase XerD